MTCRTCPDDDGLGRACLGSHVHPNHLRWKYPGNWPPGEREKGDEAQDQGDAGTRPRARGIPARVKPIKPRESDREPNQGDRHPASTGQQENATSAPVDRCDGHRCDHDEDEAHIDGVHQLLRAVLVFGAANCRVEQPGRIHGNDIDASTHLQCQHGGRGGRDAKVCRMARTSLELAARACPACAVAAERATATAQRTAAT